MNIKMVSAAIKGLYTLNTKRSTRGFRPPLLSVKLTDRCNYRCISCNEWKIGDRKKELGFAIWKDFLEDFRELGGISVRFTGGEPLLRKHDLFDLIEYAKKLGLRVSIATNGHLLTEHEIARMKFLGVDHVTISLHGKPETHNKIVGIEGSWERLNKIILVCRKKAIPLSLAFTILKHNLRDIPFIVTYCKEKKLSVRFNVFDPNPYFFSNIEKTLAPSKEELEEGTSKLLELKKKYPKQISMNKREIQEILNLFIDSRLPHYYCARVLMELFVDSFGNVYHGCWAMKPTGNIKEQKLLDILKSSLYRNQREKAFKKRCPGCTCGYGLDVKMNLVRRKK